MSERSLKGAVLYIPFRKILLKLLNIIILLKIVYNYNY